MKKIGNIFSLAIKQLNNEVIRGDIPFYLIDDVFAYAKRIRKWLDDNPKNIREKTKLSFIEKKKYNTYLRRQKYLRTGK